MVRPNPRQTPFGPKLAHMQGNTPWINIVRGIEVGWIQWLTIKADGSSTWIHGPTKPNHRQGNIIQDIQKTMAVERRAAEAGGWFGRTNLPPPGSISRRWMLRRWIWMVRPNSPWFGRTTDFGQSRTCMPLLHPARLQVPPVLNQP